MFGIELRYALTVVLAGLVFGVAWAETSGGGITLIGRGDKVKVINKNGSTQNIDAKTLHVNSSANGGVSGPATSAEKTAAGAGDAEGKKKAEADKNSPAGKAAASAEEDPKKKAAREKEDAARKEAEKQRLRGLINQGGWFYDAAGNALTGDEVLKRIESGKIGDIKTVDLYQQEWKTSPDKEDAEEKADTPKKAEAPTKAEAPAKAGSPATGAAVKADTSVSVDGSKMPEANR